MPESTKFQIVFPESSREPDKCKEWDDFLVNTMMKHKLWVWQFDTWQREKSTRGQMSMSDPSQANDIVDMLLVTFMHNNGFTGELMKWGEYILTAPQEIPTKLSDKMDTFNFG